MVSPKSRRPSSLGEGSGRKGEVAKRSNASDCKSDAPRATKVRILPSPPSVVDGRLREGRRASSRRGEVSWGGSPLPSWRWRGGSPSPPPPGGWGRGGGGGGGGR